MLLSLSPAQCCDMTSLCTITQVLSLSQATVGQLSVGHIVNLASNDVQRFDPVSTFRTKIIFVVVEQEVVQHFST